MYYQYNDDYKYFNTVVCLRSIIIICNGQYPYVQRNNAIFQNKYYIIFVLLIIAIVIILSLVNESF